MEHADKIQGNNIFSLLEKTRQEKTMLRMNVLGSGYEALTVIISIDIRERDNMSFIIDRPGRREPVSPLIEGKKCFFEFSGKDKIQYTFKASIKKIEDDCLIMRFPDVIDRIQRRRHFRVPAPVRAKLFMPHENNEFEFDIINLSEGGALVCNRIRYHDKTVLYRESVLKNVRLTCNEEDLRTSIHINKAEVVRINKDTKNRKYDYAIKFTDISKQDEKRIREFVYDCQRRELKRRGYMED